MKNSSEIYRKYDEFKTIYGIIDLYLKKFLEFNNKNDLDIALMAEQQFKKLLEGLKN